MRVEGAARADQEAQRGEHDRASQRQEYQQPQPILRGTPLSWPAELAPSGEGPAQGHLVGVLQISANG